MRNESVSIGSIGGIAIALLVVGGIGLGGWAINVLSQPLRVVSKTVDADNMIGNYEWFKKQFNEYAAFKTKLANAERAEDAFKASAGDRSTWTFDDKQEAARLASVKLGLQQQIATIAGDYNARSAMANRSIFKGGDLPDQLAP